MHHYKQKVVVFTLVELLIVISILGVLVSLVLPTFNSVDDDARLNLAKFEMREIQQAFSKFASDVVFRSEIRGAIGGMSEELISNRKLFDIALYGLWPLLIEHHPVLKEGDQGYVDYGNYDFENMIGRRGSYLSVEDFVEIGKPEIIGSMVGQTEGMSGKIPVLKDPYGGYYRVICPEVRSDAVGNRLNEFKRLERLVLVCTGANGILETFSDSFADGVHESMVDELEARGDDIIIRLMPFSGF
ncbi:MAG: type II secretion system protein [Lentisphaeria bacterium]